MARQSVTAVTTTHGIHRNAEGTQVLRALVDPVHEVEAAGWPHERQANEVQ